MRSDHFPILPRTPIDGLYICGSSLHPGGGNGQSILIRHMNQSWFSRVESDLMRVSFHRCDGSSGTTGGGTSHRKPILRSNNVEWRHQVLDEIWDKCGLQLNWWLRRHSKPVVRVDHPKQSWDNSINWKNECVSYRRIVLGIYWISYRKAKQNRNESRMR